jgi:hypothetical protein
MKILPEESPSETAPLSGTDYIVENAITHRNRVIHEGKNMFVTLLTGDHFVGLVLAAGNDHITVGHSAPIAKVLIETAREV